MISRRIKFQLGSDYYSYDSDSAMQKGTWGPDDTHSNWRTLKVSPLARIYLLHNVKSSYNGYNLKLNIVFYKDTEQELIVLEKYIFYHGMVTRFWLCIL